MAGYEKYQRQIDDELIHQLVRFFTRLSSGNELPSIVKNRREEVVILYKTIGLETSKVVRDLVNTSQQRHQLVLRSQITEAIPITKKIDSLYKELVEIKRTGRWSE